MDDKARLGRPRKWTERLVIEEIKKLSRRGVRLTFRGLRDAGEGSLLHIIHHYGGLPRLRLLAGVPPPRHSWNRCALGAEDVKHEIRMRHARGQPLAWSEISPALQHAAQRHYGSWYAAITAAGLGFERAARSSR